MLSAETLEEIRKIVDPMPWPSLGSDPRGQRAIVRESSYFAEFNPERVTSLRFLHDGTLTVLGTLGPIRIWDVKEGRVRLIREFANDDVESVANNDRVLLSQIGGFSIDARC